MSSDNLLMGLAVVMVVVAVVGMGFTYVSVSDVKQSLTGFGVLSDTAITNLSITTNIVINFTTNNIDFGSGRVLDTKYMGILSSTGLTTNTTGFTTVTNGFVLENMGNQNVTLKLKTAKDAAGFLGGTGPRYQFNVTNKDADSCVTPNAGYTFGTYVDAALADNQVCDKFNCNDAADTLRIDVMLYLPSDSSTGLLSDTMTATAAAAP